MCSCDTKNAYTFDYEFDDINFVHGNIGLCLVLMKQIVSCIFHVQFMLYEHYVLFIEEDARPNASIIIQN